VGPKGRGLGAMNPIPKRLAMSSGTVKKDNVQDKAKDAMTHATDAVKSVGGAVAGAADQAAGGVGSGMQYVADQARRHLPSEGVMGTASKYVADGLEQSGKYLEDKGITGMGEDLTSIIKNHPVTAMLIGIGVGYLLGRTLSRS
jgi:phage-related protein